VLVEIEGKTKTYEGDCSMNSGSRGRPAEDTEKAAGSVLLPTGREGMATHLTGRQTDIKFHVAASVGDATPVLTGLPRCLLLAYSLNHVVVVGTHAAMLRGSLNHMGLPTWLP
jgi:hypothetical protein